MTAITSATLQRPVLRHMLRIPALPAHPPKLPTFMESRAAFYKYMMEEAQAKGPKPKP
jgi:hypothetical protein